MADGQLRFTLTFDKKTGALNAVEQELKKVESRGKKAAASVGRIQGKLSGINNVLGTFALGGFLVQTIRQAAGASDSMSDLQATFNETIGTIVRGLEPAIAKVTGGLQGFLILLPAVGTLLIDHLVGPFKIVAAVWEDGISGGIKATKEWANKTKENLGEVGDALGRASERIQGITSASEKDLTKIIIDEAKIRLADASLSGAEKLEIIEEVEAKALAEIKKSGEFQVADAVRQKKLILDVEKQFAIEREGAQREMLRQQQEAAMAEVEVAKAAVEAEGITLEERLRRNEELLQVEVKNIEKQGKQKVQSEQVVNTRIEAAMVRHQRRALNIQKAATSQELAEQNKRNADRLADLARFTGVTEARLNTIADAGARELEESRNAVNAGRAMAAAGIRDLANQASRTITLKGVEAAAKVFAETPGIIFTRIAAAAAVGVFYAGLAATVSGLGGIAARSIAPPSASGGGASSPAPTGPLGTPPVVSFEPPPGDEDTGGGKSEAEEEPIEFGSAPGTEVAGGVPVIVNISAPFGGISPDTLDKVVEAVAEAKGD